MATRARHKSTPRKFRSRGWKESPAKRLPFKEFIRARATAAVLTAPCCRGSLVSVLQINGCI